MGYLTRTDVENFGPELLDVAQRAAADVMVPAVDSLQQQNEALRQQLADQAYKNLEQELDQRIPGWREVNQRPDFHRWLRGTHEPSGYSRQALLDDAVTRNDARRASYFFHGFLREQGIQPQSQAPRRTRTTPTSGTRIYNRSDIE